MPCPRPRRPRCRRARTRSGACPRPTAGCSAAMPRFRPRWPSAFRHWPCRSPRRRRRRGCSRPRWCFRSRCSSGRRSRPCRSSAPGPLPRRRHLADHHTRPIPTPLRRQEPAIETVSLLHHDRRSDVSNIDSSLSSAAISVGVRRRRPAPAGEPCQQIGDHRAEFRPDPSARPCRPGARVPSPRRHG